MSEMEDPKVAMTALLIEDSDSKAIAIAAAVEKAFGQAIAIKRAATITSAEEQIELSTWSLVILDISLDIAASASGPGRGGHATLGGMAIARKMFLLGRDVPTVIVTAFDAFQSASGLHGDIEILGLEEVELSARGILGCNLLGCVRYGDPDWETQFIDCLRRARL